MMFVCGIVNKNSDNSPYRLIVKTKKATLSWVAFVIKLFKKSYL